MNGYQQGFRFVASFGFGGQESASKPPQAICKPLPKFNMFNYTYLFILLVFLLSCCHEVKPKKENSDDSITKSQSSVKPKKLIPSKSWRQNDLSTKVFTVGNENHLKENCDFYFACDCCKSELLLNSDSTFYMIDHCMADLSISGGNYLVTNSALHLSYNGSCISREYNWAREADTSAMPHFFIKDTVYKPYQAKFNIDFCEKRIRLIKISEKNKFIGLEKETTIEESVKILNKDSLIARLNDIKNS